jgi:hypothetical protein
MHGIKGYEVTHRIGGDLREVVITKACGAVGVAVIILLLFALPVVLGDIGPYPASKLEIQGAHIVSEGAYFRFWIANHYDQPVYVTINDGEALYIPHNASADYDVIAPQISVPYEEVTYTFRQYFYPTQNISLPSLNFTVLVVHSSFFDFLLPIHFVVAAGLIVVCIAFFTWQRRLIRRKVGVKHTLGKTC